MNFKKLLLPTLLIVSSLASCGPATSSSNAPTSSSMSSTSSSESQGPLPTKEDLAFNGVSIKEGRAYSDKDYKFGGILSDISLDCWVVAGDKNLLTVEKKSGATPELSFKFQEKDIFEITTEEYEGVKSYYITGLKTGGSEFSIYAGEDLVFRYVVNCRVPVRDTKLILDKLAEADFWYGIMTSSSHSGDYRLIFEEDENGLYTKCSLNLTEVSTTYGQCQFNILTNTKEEFHRGTFHTMRYYVEITKAALITPVYLDISLSLDNIVIMDREMPTDFFRPKYL